MLQGQETYLLKIRVYAVLKFSFSRFKKAVQGLKNLTAKKPTSPIIGQVGFFDQTICLGFVPESVPPLRVGSAHAYLYTVLFRG